MYLIDSAEVTTTSTSSVTFSSISQSYKHLCLRFTCASSDTSGSDTTLDVTFNGVSSGYTGHRALMRWKTGSVTEIDAFAVTSGTSFTDAQNIIDQSNATSANVPMVGEYWIPNYSTDGIQKTLLANSSFTTLISDDYRNRQEWFFGLIPTTGSVQSVTFTLGGQAFRYLTQYSRFYLYGTY